MIATHRQKIPTKTLSDIFMSACPHPSPLGLYGLGCGSNNDSYAPTNRFWTHSCSPPLSCLLAWFYAVTRISARCQRASITLPRATFHACAMRKHFTRRSNDRRISCLRDSADISPPGAACPACPRSWLILLRICKITSIAATQSERGTEKDRRVKFIVQIMFFISASLFDI